MSEPPSEPQRRTSDPGARETEACRTCGRPVTEGEKFHPFCSRRCRDVDLGNWFSGSYSISRDIKDADLDALD